LCSPCTLRAEISPQNPPSFAPMASFQKTASGWRVQLEVRGQRASSSFPTKRQAQDWADEKARELKASAVGNKGHGKTLRDALRRFAEEESPKRRGERLEIIRLAAFEGEDHGLPIERRLEHITDDDIRAWRDRRLRTRSRGTVLRDMTLLSAVLEVARTEWKWLPHNIVREVKKPSKPAHRSRVITGLEIRRVLRALGYTREPARTVSQSIAVCFLLALSTGMRAGELCGLRWEDVREAYGTARDVKARERGVSRDVPFSPVARRLVSRMEGWDEETVFGLRAQTLDALFRRAKKRSGCEGFVFHDSRHTAATRLAQRLHVLDLCKMFGWTNPKMAMVYYNPTAAQIAGRL
jgi:integrase